MQVTLAVRKASALASVNQALISGCAIWLRTSHQIGTQPVPAARAGRVLHAHS